MAFSFELQFSRGKTPALTSCCFTPAIGGATKCSTQGKDFGWGKTANAVVAMAMCAVAYKAWQASGQPEETFQFVGETGSAAHTLRGSLLKDDLPAWFKKVFGERTTGSRTRSYGSQFFQPVRPPKPKNRKKSKHLSAVSVDSENYPAKSIRILRDGKEMSSVAKLVELAQQIKKQGGWKSNIVEPYLKVLRTRRQRSQGVHTVQLVAGESSSKADTPLVEANLATTLKPNTEGFDAGVREHRLSRLTRKLLADPLIGLSLADRRTQPEWNFAFEKAQQRLKRNPEDTFLRAMLVWSTLLKGDPDQILKIVQDAATWLQLDQADDSARNIELWSKRKELWLNRIAGIRDKSIEDPDCVRVVLEDTLVREALLRWLKTDGRFSPLAERIRSINTCGVSNDAKTIFENARHQHAENWVPGAIDDAYNWISAVHSLGLPHVYLLWLTGRELKSRNQIPSVIQLALNWLENHRNINDSLVRWGSIWLAGMLVSNQYTTSSLIQRTSKWLKSPDSTDDRLVRWAYLWLVGGQGTKMQLKTAIAETTKWLNDPRNQNDTCVRLAFLFSVRRAVERGGGTVGQLEDAIDKLRPWVQKDQLIELAVALVECSLPIPHVPVDRSMAQN